MKSELEDFINNNREAFDNKMPDPAVLQKLLQQMEPNIKKKDRAIVIPMKVARWAAACIVLLVGAAIFWNSQRGPVKEIKVPEAIALTNKSKQDITPDTGITSSQTPEETIQDKNLAELKLKHDNDINDARRASVNNKQVFFARLNNQESPGSRIDAVQEAYRLTNKDNDIIDALAKTMNTDPNTNVRLAALDALSKFHREPYVKKKLVASLKKQTDPMVQIGLIELLTKMREKSILEELDNIVNDGTTMDAVKDHAYSSIFLLRS